MQKDAVTLAAKKLKDFFLRNDYIIKVLANIMEEFYIYNSIKC